MNQGGQRFCILGGADHQVIALRSGALLNAGHNGAQERVIHGAALGLRRDMRDHADDGRMIVGQGACSHAGDVVLPFDDLPDLGDPLGGDTALPVVHHVRHGRDADASLSGNILQCDHSYLPCCLSCAAYRTDTPMRIVYLFFPRTASP